MKMTIAAVLLAGIAAPALAQTHVRPYVKQDGTYVQPHVRSAPDGNPYNNYSTSGNSNPWTGQAGTVNPQPSPYNPPKTRY